MRFLSCYFFIVSFLSFSLFADQENEWAHNVAYYMAPSSVFTDIRGCSINIDFGTRLRMLTESNEGEIMVEMPKLHANSHCEGEEVRLFLPQELITKGNVITEKFIPDEIQSRRIYPDFPMGAINRVRAIADPILSEVNITPPKLYETLEINEIAYINSTRHYNSVIVFRTDPEVTADGADFATNSASVSANIIRGKGHFKKCAIFVNSKVKVIGFFSYKAELFPYNKNTSTYDYHALVEIEYDRFEGGNLCAKGDQLVVALNHLSKDEIPVDYYSEESPEVFYYVGKDLVYNEGKCTLKAGNEIQKIILFQPHAYAMVEIFNNISSDEDCNKTDPFILSNIVKGIQ